MSSKRLRSGKSISSQTEVKRLKEVIKSTAKPEDLTEDAMTTEILQELHSMRNDLTSQMRKLSGELSNFQQDTNARLSKIESVMSKLDEIDNLNDKQQEIEDEVNRIKDSVNSSKSSVETLECTLDATTKELQESNRLLQKKIEHLERYSRDFNIRLIGVEEKDAEDCISIVHDYFTLLGFENASAELENAHRTGKRRDDKPRHIIAKLYSRPFKRNLLRTAKNPGTKEILNGVRIVEDFTSSDFELRKKALPLMKVAFEDGKKVRFTKGKLLIDGKAVSF